MIFGRGEGKQKDKRYSFTNNLTGQAEENNRRKKKRRMGKETKKSLQYAPTPCSQPISTPMLNPLLPSKMFFCILLAGLYIKIRLLARTSINNVGSPLPRAFPSPHVIH